MSKAQRFYIVLNLFLLLSGHHSYILKPKYRIISGKPVKPGQFPWNVVLKKTKDGPLHGSGSIISPNWILTAAHCIYNLETMHVVVGTIYWKDPKAITLVSRQLYPHSKFNFDTHYNDIGLMKLPKSLKFTSRIQPVPLAGSAYKGKNLIGTRGTIIGFGDIHNNMPNIFGDLLQATVTVIPNEDCAEDYGEIIVESTLCTVGSHRNEAICDGDSGGSLVIPDTNGKNIQIGVISFSAEISCEENHPSVYTRVTPYLNFISQITNIKFY